MTALVDLAPAPDEIEPDNNEFYPHRFFADESDNNNAPFNARAYKDAGREWYACKATQGLDGSQGPYAERVTAAHEHGLKVVHYHFAEPGLGVPASQMRFFLHTIKDHFHPGDHAVLDVEVDARDDPQTTTAWTKAAFKFLAEKGHPEAPLYTGLAFLLAHGKDIVPPSKLLWVADYGRPGDSIGTLWRDVASTVKAYGSLWALQFTDSVHGPTPHTLEGINGPCDVSVLT
jgi:GH25 family lysozyme M1 (1,4-beta-N-acetylmuramidase)